MDRENESERRNGTESESDRSRSPLTVIHYIQITTFLSRF